jgi:HK97 family phage portal protein
MTSFVFRETLMTHLLLWGNAYAQIIRNGKGEVVALYPLMPDRMQVDRDEHGAALLLYTRKAAMRPTMKTVTVASRLRMCCTFPGSALTGLVGYSPIAMAKNAIGMAMACEEYGAKFFANGANPSGVLEHPAREGPGARSGKAGKDLRRLRSNSSQDCRAGGRHEVHAYLHLPGAGAVPGDEEIPD